MNLVERMMEPFVVMEKKRTPDGAGGFVVEWSDGIDIEAVAVLDTTIQAVIAEKQGATSVWTVTTKRAVQLEYHDVIKRKRDGRTFRITSNGGDVMSPAFASFDISQVKAERWDLT